MGPLSGALIADEGRAGRYLRVASHPDADRVVLSIWQRDECLATVRLDRQSVSDLICGPVSYTHLDVYKRQRLPRRLPPRTLPQTPPRPTRLPPT